MHLSRFTLFLSSIFLASLASSPHPLPAQEPTPRPTFVNEHSDLNRDNVVDAEDLLILMQDWGKVTGPGNLLPVEMVNLPPGSFLMGNSESARDAESSLGVWGQPQHQVNIAYAFQMGKYEVTNSQYAEVLNWAKGRGYVRNSGNQTYNGGDVYHSGQLIFAIVDGREWWEQTFIAYNGSQFFVEAKDGQPQDTYPAVRMTWYGAVTFCNWLSEKEGRTPAYNLPNWSLTNRQGGGYRLPSESEWEYACRGSSNNPNRYNTFSFGDDTSLGLGCTFSARWNDYMVWCGNASNYWSRPVGSKLPNDYGLHDMHGNVAEWCEDWFHGNYIGAPTDGTAWFLLPSIFHRVVRSGYWGNAAGNCRSAARERNYPYFWDVRIGFRVVRFASP